MDERLERLERRLDDVSVTLRRLEARVQALEEDQEEHGPRAAGVVESSALAAGEGPDLPGLLTHLGRCVLVLGGAFLIRAITDSGAIAAGTGVALGLAYAVSWLLIADRTGRRRNAIGAAFCGVIALVIAYPLLWEATFRFQVLTATAAAAAVTVLTALALLVAWRTSLQVLAWAGTLGAVATVVPMLVVTRFVVGFGFVLLAVGLATVWLAYSRRWHGVRWPAAVAVDLMVLQATVLAARPGGPIAPYHGLSLAAVAWLAVAFVLVYLGSFAARILARQRNPTAFEALQSLAVLAIGLGGAWRVGDAAGWSPVPLGLGVLALAACAYGVAFTFIERRDGRGLSFQFFASIALLLALIGARHTLSEAGAALLWCGLCLVAAALAARFDRITLRIHSAAYLIAAAFSSGLLAWTFDALFAAASVGWGPRSVAAMVSLVAAAVAYPLLACGHRPSPPRWFNRLPAMVAAIVAALGAAGLGVAGVVAASGGAADSVDPGVLAAARSALVAAAVLAFAALGRLERFAELSWLVYPLLVGAGVKLLLEDLVRGRALTLFPALACYGIALIVAPRLLRSRR